MKICLAWSAVLWFALVLENVWHESFVSFSLILPLAAGCIFSQKTGLAVIMAGTVLLLRWMLQPSMPPIEVITVLVSSLVFLSAQNSRHSRLNSPEYGSRKTGGWPVLIVTLVGLTAHALVQADLSPVTAASLLWSRTTVAVPCLALIMFVTWAVDEFGFRRAEPV